MLPFCLVREPQSWMASEAYAQVDVASVLLEYDAYLLDWVDQRQPDCGLFRVWESPATFVVLGYGKQADADVFVAACKAEGIPIRRRCSGGGTVLQMPGCLSYSVIVPMALSDCFATITSTTHWVMSQQAACLSAAIGKPIDVQGTSDLTLSGLKFSGNAQRRGRRSVLFHGTFLCEADIALVSRYLQIPSYQPEYRANRTHASFLCNLGISTVRLAQFLSEWWLSNQPYLSINYTDMQEELLTRVLDQHKG